MNTRKKYPKEFKLDAISLVLDQSYTRIEAANSNTNASSEAVVSVAR